jgi:hypothetical protein
VDDELADFGAVFQEAFSSGSRSLRKRRDLAGEHLPAVDRERHAPVKSVGPVARGNGSITVDSGVHVHVSSVFGYAENFQHAFNPVLLRWRVDALF